MDNLLVTDHDQHTFSIKSQSLIKKRTLTLREFEQNKQEHEKID